MSKSGVVAHTGRPGGRARTDPLPIAGRSDRRAAMAVTADAAGEVFGWSKISTWPICIGALTSLQMSEAAVGRA